MKSIQAHIRENFIGADQVSRKRDGTIMVRQSYFYRHGMDSTQFADKVSEFLKEEGIAATVIDSGDHYADFRGGASVAKQSHFWAQVKIEA